MGSMEVMGIIMGGALMGFWGGVMDGNVDFSGGGHKGYGGGCVGSGGGPKRCGKGVEGIMGGGVGVAGG